MKKYRISAKTINFCFRIMAIFDFKKWLVTIETIEGVNYLRGETIRGNTVLYKAVITGQNCKMSPRLKYNVSSLRFLLNGQLCE